MSARRDAPPEISDISLMGKIEIRGDLDSFEVKDLDLVRVTPTRGLVLCDFPKTIDVLERLQADYLAIDLSGTLAGLQVRQRDLGRRQREGDAAVDQRDFP